MKVSKAQSAENRQAIVDAAARLYRERGFAGVGVAEISREAGFTHGGFYGHFASKDALAAEACQQSLSQSLAKLQTSLTQHRGDARPYFQRYLRAEHRDHPGAGCAIAALAAEAARAEGPVPAALTEGIAGYLQALATHRPDGSLAEVPGADDKARAVLALSALVGGLVLARATAEA
ncbi:MAG TPA: TetR family transcriptional regulator, partial [Roseateles sp.]|nr:TetR family transcriptional regulator [Roseateles sp.]